VVRTNNLLALLLLLLVVSPLCLQVGSVFEYFDKNAIFGVVQPDSPLWLPIIGLFAITGLPTAGAGSSSGSRLLGSCMQVQGCMRCGAMCSACTLCHCRNHFP
jgi:hypothetical protein